MTDQSRQASAVAAIESAIGADAVERAPDVLSAFKSNKAEPIAIVQPGDEDDLAKVLAATKSVGGMLQPVCNGASALDKASQDNVIIVDLQKMNRILDVNEQLATCLVEPGVTFRQLDEHLRQNGINLWVDYPGNPDESVAASFLNRTAGNTPYADHYLMQCGLEVMLADGKQVRTGMGAMPKSTCWQLFKFGYGPWIDGLFTQSDFAVVTKVGMWMMPRPPAYQTFMVTVANEDDLGPLLDVLGPLKLNMVVPNGVAVANGLHEVALMGKSRAEFGGTGPVSASQAKVIGEAHGLGYWNLYGAIYGLPDNVPILWQMVRDAFASIGGAKVILGGKGVDPRIWKWREGTMIGKVADAPGTVAGWTGERSLSVNPVSPVDGEEGMRLYSLSKDICADHGFDYLGQANAVWRSANHRQILPYARENERDADKARACGEQLIAAQAEAGFGQIMAESELIDAAQAPMRGGGLSTLHSRVKQALDATNLFALG